MGVRISAGWKEALAPGQVRPVALPRARDGRPREALVLRDHGGELRAYLNRCEHLPIPIDGGARRFLSSDGQHLQCGTHGARFRLEDGYCVEGPCVGRALQAIPLEVEDGVVYLLVDPT